MTSSPQQDITQTLRLTQAQILTLNSNPFIIVPAEAGFVNVSNSLNALNILGITQSTSISFEAVNPYNTIMSNSSNSSIALTISGSNPLGGDPGSSLSINFTYSIFQL